MKYFILTHTKKKNNNNNNYGFYDRCFFTVYGVSLRFGIGIK